MVGTKFGGITLARLTGISLAVKGLGIKEIKAAGQGIKELGQQVEGLGN